MNIVTAIRGRCLFLFIRLAFYRSVCRRYFDIRFVIRALLLDRGACDFVGIYFSKSDRIPPFDELAVIAPADGRILDVGILSFHQSLIYLKALVPYQFYECF